MRKHFDKSRHNFTKRVLTVPFIVSGMCTCPSLAHSKPVRSFDVSKYNKILVPKGHGEILSMSDGHHGRYPSRYHSMQFIAFLNSRKGLYIQTKDIESHMTVLVFSRSGKLNIKFYRPRVDTHDK